MNQENLNQALVSYRQVIAQIVDNGGEVTPEIETALTTIDMKIPIAVDMTATMMERMELEESYWKTKAEEFAKTAKGLASARARIKETLKFLMEQAQLDELKGIDVRFKLSNSKPSLVINEELLDDVYVERVTTSRPNKKLIEEELKLGIPIEGAMFVESKSLRMYANSKAGE